jgi:PAS domain S-box-containing protein
MATPKNPVPGANILWLSGIAVITLIIILVSIFSLKNGYSDIFPYFYILPILLLAYRFPKYAVYLTVVLGWIFLGLVYLYGQVDIRLYAVSSAWFYVFVSIGVVISAFAGELLHERKYREIFENSQAGIFTFETQTGKIREINQHFAAILGYDPKEMRGMIFSTLWFDSGQEERFMRDLRDGKPVSDLEIELRQKDRTIIWGLATASPTDDGLVICSVVDVTERKRVKDDLIESELRYRTLFDGASDAIFIHDTDGKIFETNLIASRYLGYTKRELMQMRMQDFDLAPEKLFDKEAILQLNSRGHILFSTVQKQKDGTTLPVEISSRTTEYFGMSAVISIVRDISERCGT